MLEIDEYMGNVNGTTAAYYLSQRTKLSANMFVFKRFNYTNVIAVN